MKVVPAPSASNRYSKTLGKYNISLLPKGSKVTSSPTAANAITAGAMNAAAPDIGTLCVSLRCVRLRRVYTASTTAVVSINTLQSPTQAARIFLYCSISSSLPLSSALCFPLPLPLLIPLHIPSPLPVRLPSSYTYHYPAVALLPFTHTVTQSVTAALTFIPSAWWRQTRRTPEQYSAVAGEYLQEA